MRWREVLLVAAAHCVCAQVPRLHEVCNFKNSHIVCRCTAQHKIIDVVSSDTSLLKAAEDLTVQDCPLVKLPVHSLYGAPYLRHVHLHNLSRLEIDSPLPRSVQDLTITDIGLISEMHNAIFQNLEEMNELYLQNVRIEKLEPSFLHGLTLKKVEIRDSQFPILVHEAVTITADVVVIINNTFAGLNKTALYITAPTVNVTNNVFERLANYSVIWQGGLQGQLVFRDNNIRVLEKGALSAIDREGASALFKDNVLECSSEFKKCKEAAALSSQRPLCDADNVCRYRNRTALEALAAKRGCRDGPLSGERCALLLVQGTGVVAAPLGALVTAVVAVLLSA